MKYQRNKFNQYQLREIIDMIRKGRTLDYVATYFGTTMDVIRRTYYKETGQNVREYRRNTLGR